MDKSKAQMPIHSEIIVFLVTCEHDVEVKIK
jgi:hypothetical protein